MNEKINKFFRIGFFVLLLCTYVLGVCYYRTVRRTDIEIDSLTEQLAEVSTRLNNSTDTIRQCSEGLGTIAEGLGTESEGLADVIRQLQVVRNSVQDMENCINNFYNLNGGPDTTYNTLP